MGWDGEGNKERRHSQPLANNVKGKDPTKNLPGQAKDTQTRDGGGVGHCNGKQKYIPFTKV